MTALVTHSWCQKPSDTGEMLVSLLFPSSDSPNLKILLDFQGGFLRFSVDSVIERLFHPSLPLAPAAILSEQA